MGAPAAQMERRFPRQHDIAGTRGDQQAPVQQPLEMRGRAVGDPAVGRAPQQLVEDGDGFGGRGVEQRRHPGTIGEQPGERGGRGDRVVGGGQPGRGDDLLKPPRRHPRHGLGDGRAQAGRRRMRGAGAEQLTGRTHQPQPVVRAPHQRLRTQLRDRPGQLGGDRGVPGVPGHQRAQRVVRARVGRHRQCLGGLEHEPVEALHRAHDRRPRPGPGGELGDIAGHRIEQVGTGPQQPDEPAVGAGPELLGEGAGCTGHSSYVSGAGPDGGPCGGSLCAQRRHGTRTPPRSVPRGLRPVGGPKRYRRGSNQRTPQGISWGSRAISSSMTI